MGEGPTITLEDLGNVAELLGIAAVVASLVYLAIQIRRNTDQMRLNERATAWAAYAATQGQLSGWTRWVTTSGIDELIDRWSREPEEITPEERDRLRRVLGEFLCGMDDLFHLWERGLVDDDTWENQFRTALGFLSRPRIRAVAAGRSGPISRRFYYHLERHIGGQTET